MTMMATIMDRGAITLTTQMDKRNIPLIVSEHCHVTN
jgi:hypothetical protein